MVSTAHVSASRVSLGVFAAIFLSILCTGCGPSDSSELVRQAEKRVLRGDLSGVEQQLKQLAADDKAWARAQLLLGKMAARRRETEQALALFQSVPRDGSDESLAANQLAAEIQMKNCLLTGAAECYLWLASRSPEDLGLKTLLASLLVLGGERSQADAILMDLLYSGKISLKDLIMLTQRERQPPEARHLLQCTSARNSDSMTLFALATADLEAGQTQAAIEKLQVAVRTRPEFTSAQSLLGELLLEDNAPAALAKWAQQVPVKIQTSPDLWYLRGLLARRQQASESAARCFWEAVRQDPLHRKAMFQLGQILEPLRPEAAAAFQSQADRILDFSLRIERVLNAGGQDPEGFAAMIRFLVESGRLPEAIAWIRMDANRHGELNLPTAIREQLSVELTPQTPRFAAAADLTRRFDLSDFAAPEWNQHVPSATAPPTTTDVESITFADQAAKLGIDFTYLSGTHGRTQSIRVFESTGGGTGVLDYDLDGAPDIFFTQGEPWPLKSPSPTPSAELSDVLFRNRSTEFRNVTGLAFPIPDDGYGQGCNSADFDNDGFPDLYVANIGGNRLFRNNGDGTFSDVTTQAGLTQTAWTTSCAMLDLNADGLPDLYDVNYLQGQNVFEVECGENRCSVLNFDGAPDHVMLSAGDGTFNTVPGATPDQTPKGLGIVGMQLPGENKPRLFIANDQVPNFFLRAQSDNTYLDEALPRGLAVNYLGKPTACMGVAAGDVNRDGRLDLFVTNFEREANCLYLQRDGGFFEDAIQGSGLFQAGIPYVGWGTQFLDADNDQDLDIAVANGHVAEFGEPGIEYRMPLQFFRNNGETSFSELNPTQAGALFQVKRLGRSLATLDWNSDGALDFVVSSISSPAVLATNQTVTSSHWLRLILHGTDSARDCSGTAVRASAGGIDQWAFVPAGDGYQSSNERCLHFGLGNQTVVDRLEIRWPSGRISQLNGIPADSTLHLIEGRQQVFPVP